MIFLRSLVFNILFFSGTAFWCVALSWAFVLPSRTVRKIVNMFYLRYIDVTARIFLGLRYEVRGLENIPKEGAWILAAKHQSAYETLLLPLVVDHPVIVLKKELLRIPIWGLYARKMGGIPIDRSSGRKAVNAIMTHSQPALREGRPILVFPQGTRVAPDDNKPYKSGIGILYMATNIPVVPMALNSGVFWGRNSFIKRPGTVVFEFLPPIPAGLKPKDMLQQLEEALEPASARLVDEARRGEKGSAG